jgi:type IV pilus assembly protein PilC
MIWRMDLLDFKKQTVRQELGIVEGYGRILSFIDFGNVNYWFDDDRQDHEGVSLRDNERLSIGLERIRDFTLLFSTDARFYYGHDPASIGSMSFLRATKAIFGQHKVFTKPIQKIRHDLTAEELSENSRALRSDTKGAFVYIPKCNFDVEISVDAMRLLDSYDTFCLFEMSHFTFKAKKPTGEIYKGEKDAADRFELYRMIRGTGDEIVSVDEKAAHGLKAGISLSFLSHVKTIEKINFARNLGLMLEAGLALSRALSVIERQSKNKEFKNILSDLIANISKGMTFADALALRPKVFPPIFVSMVHAGEQSGTLSGSLKSAASQMDSNYLLEKRIRGAMMYPSVIFCVMIAIGVLMMIFVVPTLMDTFTQLNVPLPPTTQFVLGLSGLVQHQGLIILAFLIAVAAGGWWWSKKDSGKKAIDTVVLKLPIVGPLVHEVNTARTARTLSSLLNSGVDVVESVKITGGSRAERLFPRRPQGGRRSHQKRRADVQSIRADDKLYPVFFAEMLSVGEETGKIDEMLLNVAKYYEDDVEQKTKDMSAIIEPLLIVVIGAAVGILRGLDNPADLFTDKCDLTWNKEKREKRGERRTAASPWWKSWSVPLSS